MYIYMYVGWYVCMYVYLSYDFLDNRSSNRITLGRCIAEDPRKCSVECEVV